MIELSDPSLESVCTAMRSAREERLGKGWALYPRRNPIASDLGDCDRAMALGIVGWRHRPPAPPAARERMQNGEDAEAIVLRQLREEGWKIVEEQAPFELRSRDGHRVILTGKIEGKFVCTVAGAERRLYVPFEVKDTSFPNFMRWHTVADLLLDRYARKWVRQIYAYCVAFNFEGAVLILAHRGERRPIPIPLDYREGERILTRCEEVGEAAALLEGTPIDQLDEELTALGIAYPQDLRGCMSCDFRMRLCHPPQPSVLEGEVLVLEEGVSELVGRYLELEPAAKEHAQIGRKLEREVPRGSHASAGPYLITGTWSEQNSSKPTKPGEPPAPPKRIWHKRIIRADALIAPPAPLSEDGEGEAPAA